MAPNVGSSRLRRDFHVVDALNDEWDRPAPDRGTSAPWASAHEVLEACADLDDVLLASAREPDAALGALLTEVASGAGWPQAPDSGVRRGGPSRKCTQRRSPRRRFIGLFG